MITLPPGFDPAVLMADFFAYCVPFVGIAVLITTGVIIIKLLRRA